MLITNEAQTLEAELARALPTATDVLVAVAYIGPDALDALHIEEIGQQRPVRVVIGRALADGLPRLTLSYLKHLNQRLRGGGGGIRVARNPFHSKLYCLEQSDGSLVCAIGSSNLTSHGLSDWREANVFPADADIRKQILEEAERLWADAEPIDAAVVPIRKTSPPPNAGQPTSPSDVADELPTEPEGSGLPGIQLTLLDPQTGEVQPKSGLNWWRGGGRARDPNEALIALRAAQIPQAEKVFGSADRGTIVHAIAHDGTEFPLVIEGDGPVIDGRQKGKQIATKDSKAILGRWILRTCLGLNEGVQVTRAALEQYGRTTIGFFRLGTDPATGRVKVLMDFEPPQ